jgi:serine/threonine protein kinase
VKPANILISATHGREHVYLSDFGLSRHVHGSSGLTGTGAFLGTVDYVAPEQARGEAVDARTDVYALGCVLFQALTGTVPYPMENELAKLYAHDSQPPPSVRVRAPDVPAEFDAVCARAMAKAPDDRYQSAGDLGSAALAAAATDRPAPAAVAMPSERAQAAPTTPGRQPGSTERPGKARPRIARLPLIAGAVVLCAAVVAAVVAPTGGGSSPNASASGGSGSSYVVQSQRVSAPHGYVYKAILSTLHPPAGALPGSREPYYLGLWVRHGLGPSHRVERLRLPWRFTASSVIRQFALNANSDGSANVSLSWFVENGQPDPVTHYLTLEPTGIAVDS